MGDESVTHEQEHYRLLSLSQHSETGERPHARVAFAEGVLEHHAESDGNGPVDASLKAIESRVQSGAELLLYSVNAITSGSTESQGEVTVRLQLGGRVVNGVGADPDIIVASAKAYLAALNKLHSKGEKVAAQG
jgi:2-isopropylmalate synthase